MNTLLGLLHYFLFIRNIILKTFLFEKVLSLKTEFKFEAKLPVKKLP